MVRWQSLEEHRRPDSLFHFDLQEVFSWDHEERLAILYFYGNKFSREIESIPSKRMKLNLAVYTLMLVTTTVCLTESDAFTPRAFVVTSPRQGLVRFESSSKDESNLIEDIAELVTTDSMMATIKSSNQQSAKSQPNEGMIEQAERTPLSSTSSNFALFQNDGPLAWMQDFLDLFGIKEGKGMAYGPIPVDVEDSERVSPEVVAQRRQKATQDLVNIGPQERQRREVAGNVLACISAVYVVWATLFADHGDFGGHVLRLLAVIPIFLAVGYKESAKTGL